MLMTYTTVVVIIDHSLNNRLRGNIIIYSHLLPLLRETLSMNNKDNKDLSENWSRTVHAHNIFFNIYVIVN